MKKLRFVLCSFIAFTATAQNNMVHSIQYIIPADNVSAINSSFKTLLKNDFLYPDNNHFTPPDKCANVNFIEAEKVAREKRDNKIKEIEQQHYQEVTILEAKKKNDILKLDDDLRKNLNEGNTEATESEKIDIKSKLAAGVQADYEQKLIDAQLKEKGQKETAQITYLESVREARNLFSNAYEVVNDPYFSGTACNLHKPFKFIVTQQELNIKVPYEFVPETDSTGKFTFQFNYNIASTKGGGHYVIRNEDTCTPTLIFWGDLTSGAAGMHHTADGETQLKLTVYKACVAE